MGVGIEVSRWDVGCGMCAHLLFTLTTLAPEPAAVVAEDGELPMWGVRDLGNQRLSDPHAPRRSL